jgi:hypothetical protein
MQALTRVQRTIPWWQAALIVLIFVGLLVGQSWATFHYYTTRFPGANDFLARWSNGCALVWSGENPYSDQATLQTQIRMHGRPAQPGEDLAAYSYPLYTLYFFWPLCFAQPYAAAQAIWMTLMLYAVVAGTALMIRVAGWQPPAWLWGVTLVWTVVTYPHARAIILGQMTTVIFIALGLSLLAVHRRADFWAGAALAVTTIKPQVCFLIVPWLLWWSAWNKRWRLWGGFATAMVLLAGSGLLLVPTWPLDFIRHLLNYDTVSATTYHSLTWIIIQHFLELGPVVEIAVTGLLAIYLLVEWWQQRRATGAAMLWVTGLTLNLSNFISYRAATTSYTLLLLPLFQLLWLAQRRTPRWSNWIVLGVLIILLVSQWAVFAITMEGRFETAPVYLVLPIPLLVAQLITRRQFVADDASLSAAA